MRRWSVVCQVLYNSVCRLVILAVSQHTFTPPTCCNFHHWCWCVQYIFLCRPKVLGCGRCWWFDLLEAALYAFDFEIYMFSFLATWDVTECAQPILSESYHVYLWIWMVFCFCNLLCNVQCIVKTVYCYRIQLEVITAGIELCNNIASPQWHLILS